MRAAAIATAFAARANAAAAARAAGAVAADAAAAAVARAALSPPCSGAMPSALPSSARFGLPRRRGETVDGGRS